MHQTLLHNIEKNIKRIDKQVLYIQKLQAIVHEKTEDMKEQTKALRLLKKAKEDLEEYTKENNNFIEEFFKIQRTLSLHLKNIEENTIEIQEEVNKKIMDENKLDDIFIQVEKEMKKIKHTPMH